MGFEPLTSVTSKEDPIKEWKSGKMSFCYNTVTFSWRNNTSNFVSLSRAHPVFAEKTAP